MSQKALRKAVVTEEKDKRQTDSPVKDMKKKMAANAEKEKQAVEKTAEKSEKPAEKVEKQAEKNEKTAEKKTDKVEKKAESEKKEDANKDDKTAKSERTEAKSSKPKQNGNARVNGTASNGDHNGTVSATPDFEDIEDDDDGEADEMFPELTYDDTSDPEFEPDAPHGRSITRRSQAKVTRTPETPRPASERRADAASASAPPSADDSKDSKVLKLKEDVPSTDRKLRSADSPKPEGKKQLENKPESAKKSQDSQDKSQESAHKSQEMQQKKEETSKKTQESQDKGQDHGKRVQESSKKPQESPKKSEKDSPKKSEKESKENKEREEKENGDGKMDVVEVVVEIDDEEEPRKTDTNFSKSRVKVSPYRRSMRADHTASSTMANYTGNNTTMEMDITESSFSTTTDVSLDDSSYLSALRNIRGRRSYKHLSEITLRHLADRQRLNASASASEQPSRPTGTVVGRKRKPDAEPAAGAAAGAGAGGAGAGAGEAGKRARLFDRLTTTLRAAALPAMPAMPAMPARRNAEIVGINTDLPLTAPVASPDTFDPETLKATSTPTLATNPAHIPVSPVESDKDSKRCIVM